MAVTLLSCDYTSKYCEFSYDDWADDEKFMPKIGIPGTGVLSTVKGCCQGSMAIGTDGGIKILKGDTNEWIDY